MKSISKKRLAGIGAVALGAAMIVHSAYAAVINSGDTVTITVTTAVNNSFDVEVTENLNFGTFGTIKDPGDTDTAQGILAPNDAFTEDLAGPAKVIDANAGDHNAAVITVAAFDSTRIFVSYSNVTDLDDDITGTFVLDVDALADNLNAPGTGTGGVAGGWTSGGGNSTGYASTDGSGALVFNIGGTFSTQATVTYPSDTYSGSFDVTLSY